MLAALPVAAQEATLQKQLAAEQAARQASNPEEVADSARKLAAVALLHMAQLRQAERAWPQAAVLYQHSLALDSSTEAGAGLTEAQSHLPGGTDLASIDPTEPAGDIPVAAAEKASLQAREQKLRAILASAFTDWGTAEARQQLYPQAVERFHEAEKWDAGTPGLMSDLGNAAFRMGDYAESARALELEVLANPKDQTSQLLLGVSQFSLGNYDAAASAFEPVGTLAMQDPRAASAWAYSLARTKHQEQANRIADKLTAESLQPKELMLVCQIYNVTEDYEQAAQCFRKVGAEDPSIPHTHYLVGAALLRLDRPNDAIPELREELKIAPGNPDAEYYLAYALLETSHRQEAEALLRQVVSEAPGHAQAQYQLGKTMLEDGDASGAIMHLEAAVRLDPEADYMHYQLQTAYRRAGRTGDADRELAVYRELKAQHRAPAPH